MVLPYISNYNKFWKLASIRCPQHRETKADTLKATEANRRRGPGTREKVRSKRINLEGNTQALYAHMNNKRKMKKKKWRNFLQKYD
jgi:hypothetical protein